MPAPSIWAKRLADDLKEVGEILGYESCVESRPVEDSTLRIDVVWTIARTAATEKGVKVSDYLLPSKITIASIEIQYSESPSSISHGLIKGQYANSPYHIVVSYYELTSDFKEALRVSKPRGLKIIDGNSVLELQVWIQYMLVHERFQERMQNIEVLKEIINIQGSNMTDEIRESIEEEIDLTFSPTKVKMLFDTLGIAEIRNLEVLEEFLSETFSAIQRLLTSYRIAVPVKIAANELLEGAGVTRIEDPSRVMTYEIKEGKELNLVIYSDKMKVLGGNYLLDVKIVGRNLEAYSNAWNPPIGFTKTFRTPEAKAFIHKIIDESIKFLRKHEVTDKDRSDLEQTISVMKMATEQLGQQK